jgi:autotransporter strand-loop-strand O-heptosyltransferase
VKAETGWNVVSISKEKTTISESLVIHHNDQSLQDTIADIAGCQFYIGMSHGPAWIAYALNKPAVIISGVSEVWNEWPNPYRVINENVCHGCFNDITIPMDRGWEWCPRKEGAERFECTREITSEMVIEKIKRLLDDIRRPRSLEPREMVFHE